MKLILGIDPGLTGSLALYNPATKEVVDIKDMPIHMIKDKKHIDLYQLAGWFDEHSKTITSAIIEDPSAMPGQGVTSMFRFGQACGVMAGMTAAFFIPIIFVKPAVWKMQMGLTHDKDQSRRKASHMFPREAGRFAKKKDDGRAEALLLAVYGERYIA